MYQTDNRGDFVFVCQDGPEVHKLYFSRFLMARNRVFAAMLNAGMAESTAAEAHVAYSARTMEVILMYLDAVPRPDLSAENVAEIAMAAHFYEIPDLQRYCAELMVRNPHSNYVRVAELIMPHIKIDLLDALVNLGRLTELPREVYVELFNRYPAAKIAPAYVTDGHLYSDDLTILLNMNSFGQQTMILCEAFRGTEIVERLAKHISSMMDFTLTKMKVKPQPDKVTVLNKLK